MSIRGVRDSTSGDGLGDDDQRLVCLMAGSDFDFDSLIVKGQTARAVGPRLSDTDLRRIESIKAEKGQEAATQFEELLLFSKTAAKRTNGTS